MAAAIFFMRLANHPVGHPHLIPSFLELCRINEHQKVVLDLDPYVKKLLNARRRVVLVNNILQNAQVSGSKQELGCFPSLPVQYLMLFCGPSFTPILVSNTLFVCVSLSNSVT